LVRTDNRKRKISALKFPPKFIQIAGLKPREMSDQQGLTSRTIPDVVLQLCKYVARGNTRLHLGGGAAQALRRGAVGLGAAAAVGAQ
jgi:hypothetical protein